MKPARVAVLFVPALLAAAPASAAVVAVAPVEATFSDFVSFDPSARGLAFDSGLGTLNGVSLSFEGTFSAIVRGPLLDPAPFPTVLTADVTVAYVARTQEIARTAIEPITGPLDIVTDPDTGRSSASASLSATRGFQLSIPGDAYGTGAVSSGSRFSGASLAIPLTTGTQFRGTVSAEFDYTPVGGGGQAVPEPASLAPLGVGLAGLVAARRRRSKT